MWWLVGLVGMGACAEKKPAPVATRDRVETKVTLWSDPTFGLRLRTPYQGWQVREPGGEFAGAEAWRVEVEADEACRGWVYGVDRASSPVGPGEAARALNRWEDGALVYEEHMVFMGAPAWQYEWRSQAQDGLERGTFWRSDGGVYGLVVRAEGGEYVDRRRCLDQVTAAIER